jgi:long-subunit acyl-CoA synthetase (AMP-forming)
VRAGCWVPLQARGARLPAPRRAPLAAHRAARAPAARAHPQVADRVAAIASGIKRLGLKAKDKVAVLGVNCPDWMITMQVGGQDNKE